MSGVQQMLLSAKAPVTTYATWNASDKSAGITLSGGNLIATATTGPVGVRSTISKSSGKWYWEITVNSNTTNISLGIGNGLSTYTLGSIGLDSNLSEAYACVNAGVVGSYRYNSSDHTGLATYTSGDKIGVALDMTTPQVTFYKNNVSQGATSVTAGAQFAAFETIFVYVADTASITANFGATAFTYTPPSGFNSGLYTQS